MMNAEDVSAQIIKPTKPSSATSHEHRSEGSSQRLWSARSTHSKRLYSATTARLSPSISVYENYLLGDAIHTSDIEKEKQIMANRREHINLPPCKPSRVIHSARSLRLPSQDQSVTSPIQSNPAPSATVGQTAPSFLPSREDVMLLGYDVSPLQDHVPLLDDIVKKFPVGCPSDASSLASAAEILRLIARSENASSWFDEMRIPRADHERFVKAVIDEMSVNFYSRVLPSAEAAIANQVTDADRVDKQKLEHVAQIRRHLGGNALPASRRTDLTTLRQPVKHGALPSTVAKPSAVPVTLHASILPGLGSVVSPSLSHQEPPQVGQASSTDVDEHHAPSILPLASDHHQDSIRKWEHKAMRGFNTPGETPTQTGNGIADLGRDGAGSLIDRSISVASEKVPPLSLNTALSSPLQFGSVIRGFETSIPNLNASGSPPSTAAKDRNNSSSSSPNGLQRQVQKLKLEIVKAKRLLQECIQRRASQTPLAQSTRHQNSDVDAFARSLNTADNSNDADAVFSSGVVLDTHVQETLQLSREASHDDAADLRQSMGNPEDVDHDLTRGPSAASLLPAAGHRLSNAGAVAVSALDRIQRMVRFRQQATFFLRRKLKVLLEKKRAGGPLTGKITVENDREILSLNNATIYEGAAVSVPRVDESAITRTISPEGVSAGGEPHAAPTATSLEPLLEAFQRWELPSAFQDDRDRVALAFEEYQEAVAAVRRVHQQIHILTKGTSEEKKKMLNEVGVTVPEDEIVAKPSPPRRGSSMYHAARRVAHRSKVFGRAKSKRNGGMHKKGSEVVNTVKGSPRLVFSDTGVQTTLDDELLVKVYHRVQFAVAQEKAYRDMWSTMYVALRNIVRMWEDVEVQLSCERCKGILTDAMIIAPCGLTVCRDCLRDDDEHTFDSHEREECSCLNHDGSIPNKMMRRFVKAFAVRDVSGAITSVPSETLLSELDYQLKVVAQELGIGKTASTTEDGAKPKKEKVRLIDSGALESKNATENSSGSETPGGTQGILVSSIGKKHREDGKKRRTLAPNENRRRSVVIRTNQEDDSAEQESLEVTNAPVAVKVKPAPVPSLEETPMIALLRDIGLEDYASQLQDYKVHHYMKKISSYFQTQFRR